MDEEETSDEISLQDVLTKLAEMIMDEPMIVTSWVIMVEASDSDMNKVLLPVQPPGQPTWISKMLHREAIDSATSGEIAQVVIEDTLGDNYGGEES